MMQIGNNVDSLEGREALTILTEILTNSRVVSKCMKKSKCWFCTWDGTALSLCTDWGMRGWSTAPGKGSGDSGWLQVESEPALYPGAKKGQLYPGVHRQHCWWVREGLSHCSAIFGHLQHWVQVGCHNIRTVREHPPECYKDGEGL